MLYTYIHSEHSHQTLDFHSIEKTIRGVAAEHEFAIKAESTPDYIASITVDP